jgi:pyruvate,water dikinase
MTTNIRWFADISLADINEVGGKNASLGEMVANLSKAHVKVPNGFATTAQAFTQFLAQNNLSQKIYERLKETDVDNVNQLREAGAAIRSWIHETPFEPGFEKDVREAYAQLKKELGPQLTVAVRSSATAEDLPNASFAGQQETLLNVADVEDVFTALKIVFASLFNDRAIAYREHQGFPHEQVALSAGIQQMVRSDLASSGVMFSVDTESGFDQVVFITSSYGLGETVVQGAVNPDEFYVFKPTLAENKHAIIRKTMGSKLIKMIYSSNPEERVSTVNVTPEEAKQFSINDEDIITLARYAVSIEKHYGRPMDIEWAKDGNTGELFIVQARPETVTSQEGRTIKRYHLNQASTVLTHGRAIGQKIAVGTAKIVDSIEQMHEVKPGDVLITDMTDPDWEPVMKRAAAIVTNRGGRTCHAAIIARELGIPAIVGCGDATQTIKHGTPVTVSCAEGDTGFVYEGELGFDVQSLSVESMPKIPLKLMMNVANPDRAFDFAQLPSEGVGLARLEFIINRMIGIHPKALFQFDTLAPALKSEIADRISGYESPLDFYVDKIAEGVSTIAAAFYPKPVIVRLSDFKSNEYAHLIGGKAYEPTEENPMIGFRGASRYVAPSFAECFALECKAMHKVRKTMGLTNVQLMIPFVRTLGEAQEVIELLKTQGLESGKEGLKLIMMCEIPSNALMADEFLNYFDGFSIGSNDLTQLTLGLDRDSALVAQRFDERDPAVKKLIALAIEACKKRGKYIGICGQGPSDHPDLAEWLLAQGIESISLNPDTVIETWLLLAGEGVAG